MYLQKKKKKKKKLNSNDIQIVGNVTMLFVGVVPAQPASRTGFTFRTVCKVQYMTEKPVQDQQLYVIMLHILCIYMYMMYIHGIVRCACTSIKHCKDILLSNSMHDGILL